MIRFIILNGAGLAILLAGAVHGAALVPFQDDSTRMTWGISALAVVGILAVWRRRWKAVEWIGGTLVMLGLLGTVIGFVIALSGVDPQAASDVTRITAMVATLIEGMGVALHTTLVGAIGALWLSLNRFLLK